ncbi:S-type pyocin domain-containing protein [Pseudomonas sp. S37]|nr:S-type pyocin domain-containing protein [Pseudomonas sp. S37]
MELKPNLSQYEEHSFLGFVEAIWQAETDKATHNAWIFHFNNIVAHPAGSDLLFYSNAADDGAVNSPSYVVETVKWWHQQNGRAAFKDQVLQPPPMHQTLTRQQRADQSSNLNLEKVRRLVAEVHAAEQQAMHQLAVLQQRLAVDPVASTPEQQLAATHATLRDLEITQHQAKRAVRQLENLQMSVKFALDGAVRDASSPFLSPAIQAVALQEMTAGSQRHAAALATVQARHPDLYARGVTLIESLETRIAQLAKATASGPGHGPLTLTAVAHGASLHPALLTAQGLSREVAQYQHQLITTFRSAVAELEWQAASVQGDHPGTYADVVEFVLGTPSDDPRFALTVPLVEMFAGEALNWADLAAGRGGVHLPVRLCSTVRGAQSLTTTGVKPFTRYSHILMTLTQGKVVPSNVRVRAAVWDDARQVFAFTSEGQAPVSVTWQVGHVAYPPLDPARPSSIGYLRMPNVPLIDHFADLSQVQFDDYIVVFPNDSGVGPLYIMFRDRREV